MNAVRILTGDCLAVMPTLEAESIDAVITDPPYGLSFMGKKGAGYQKGSPPQTVVTGYGDSGGASRFFYTAKASRSERNAGLEGFEKRRGGADQFDSRWKEGTGELRQPLTRNHHPTVKPVALMRWLCRLVTPAGGVVLDPFMGSGTTGVAATNEGFHFVGIDENPEYAAIARARINEAPPSLFSGVA